MEEEFLSGEGEAPVYIDGEEFVVAKLVRM
jgi:hypothetical protein